MPTSARKTAKTAEFRVDEGIDPYDCLYIIFLIGHFQAARIFDDLICKIVKDIGQERDNREDA